MNSIILLYCNNIAEHIASKINAQKPDNCTLLPKMYTNLHLIFLNPISEEEMKKRWASGCRSAVQ